MNQKYTVTLYLPNDRVEEIKGCTGLSFSNAVLTYTGADSIQRITSVPWQFAKEASA